MSKHRNKKWWHLVARNVDPSHFLRIRSPKSHGVNTGPLCKGLRTSDVWNMCALYNMCLYIRSLLYMYKNTVMHLYMVQTDCLISKCCDWMSHSMSLCMCSPGYRGHMYWKAGTFLQLSASLLIEYISSYLMNYPLVHVTWQWWYRSWTSHAVVSHDHLLF